MDKRRVKIMSRVLDAVKLNFRARVLKEKYISWWGDFLLHTRSKKLAQKNISYSLVLGFKAEKFSLHLTKYAKRYSAKLNSLSHDIYLRAIWI